MVRTTQRKTHAAELAAAYRSLPVRCFVACWEPTIYVRRKQCVLGAEASSLEAYLGERHLAWYDKGQRIVVHGDNADVVWECTTIVQSDPDHDGFRELQAAVYYPTPTSLEILQAIRPDHEWRLEIYND